MPPDQPTPATISEEDATTLSRLQRILDPRLLYLTVLPTEKCNFRCTYCYETFEHGRMSSAVESALLRFLERRAADTEHLTLAWFGGEPLLAESTVLAITSR